MSKISRRVRPLDLPPVQLAFEVARRMGVQVQILICWETLGSTPPHVSLGPTGATWAGHRKVLLEDTFVRDLEVPGSWCYLLHEISHAVWTPLGMKPDRVSNETEGQDQWEYAVVRSLFPRTCWTEHFRFLQESTRRVGRKDTEDYRDCRRLASWRRGKDLAVLLGALDEDGRPTWKGPDLDKLVQLHGVR